MTYMASQDEAKLLPFERIITKLEKLFYILQMDTQSSDLKQKSVIFLSSKWGIYIISLGIFIS